MVTTRSGNQVQQASQAIVPRSRGRSTWFDELMKFNANRNNFCIPRRGTPDYNKIMAEVRNQAPAPASGPRRSRRSNSAPAGPSSSGSSRPVRQRNPVVRYKNR